MEGTVHPHRKKLDQIIQSLGSLEEIKKTLRKCILNKISLNATKYCNKTENMTNLLPLVLLEHIVSYCDRKERNEYYHICKTFSKITQNVNARDIHGYELTMLFSAVTINEILNNKKIQTPLPINMAIAKMKKSKF